MKFQTNLNIHCRHVSVYNYTDKVRPALSEVVYRSLEVVVRAMKKAHTEEKKKKTRAVS